MRKTFKKLSVVMAAVVAASTMLAACSSSNTNTPTTTSGTAAPTTAPTQTSGTAEPAATEPASGDYKAVVNYGITTAWDSLNPYGVAASGSFYQNLVLDKLYDRLAYIEEAGKNIKPRAATSWEQEEDGMTTIFHLNPDAKFHDGEPVTAEDWVWTLQLISNPEYQYGLKSEFAVFDGTDDSGNEVSEKSIAAEAVDDHTLKVKFKRIYPVEDWILLKNRYLYVLPKHLLGDMAPAEIMESDFWKAPVGSGPLSFISEISGSELQLKSFPDYYQGQPKFDKLVYRVVSATNTVTSVMAGEMDYFFNGPSIDDAEAAEAAGMEVLKSNMPTGATIFLINNQNVKDKRVRQALSYAIDKEECMQQAVRGEGIIASTCILPGSEYYNPATEWHRDVEKAKSLLAEAGWDSSKKLTMAVGSTRESLAALMQQQLRDAGVEIEVLTVDVATMFSGLQEGKYDLGICGSSASNYPLWMEGYYDYRNATYGQITDHAYADLQEQISKESDPAKRKELVYQYQDLLLDEMPLVMLYYSNSFGMTSERLTNINPFDSSMLNEAVWEWEIAE